MTEAPLDQDLTPGVARRLARWVTRLVAPNPGVMTGPGTNTYLVGERELAIIDPGPRDAGHVQAMVAAGAGRIRWILCTHTHPDHAAAAEVLKEATGAAIAAMPAPNTHHDFRLELDRALADDEVLRLDGLTLRAIATPGHASNHLCFLLEDNGMLFTGDHIMQGSTVVIGPPDGNMQAYLKSLRRVQSLDARVLAPGHGHLIQQPHAEAERLIQHRLARESKVRRALAAAGGSATLHELLPHVYNDVSSALHPIAARSLQAHLEKLMADGEITGRGDRYVSC